MKAARLAFTDAAMADVLEQFDWYTEKAGRIMAERWEASIAATLLKIARRPASGSPCKFTAESSVAPVGCLFHDFPGIWSSIKRRRMRF